MSLKWFHAFFIAVCVLLTIFVAAWALQHARWLLAAVTIVVGAALVMYRRAFLQKAEALERHLTAVSDRFSPALDPSPALNWTTGRTPCFKSSDHRMHVCYTQTCKFDRDESAVFFVGPGTVGDDRSITRQCLQALPYFWDSHSH